MIIGSNMEKACSFSCHQVPVEISEKLGICYVCRLVSRDRRISAMEMEASKPTHVPHLLLIV